MAGHEGERPVKSFSSATTRSGEPARVRTDSTRRLLSPGQTIQSPEDLTAAVGAKAPGDKVTVTYVRNGSTKTAQVTIGTRPS